MNNFCMKQFLHAMTSNRSIYIELSCDSYSSIYLHDYIFEWGNVNRASENI